MAFTPDNLILEAFESDFAVNRWSVSGISDTNPNVRTGKGMAIQSHSFQPSTAFRTLPANSRYIVGFLFYVTSIATGVVFDLRRNGTVQIRLTSNSSGSIIIQRGAGSATLITSSTGILSPNQMIYLELDVTISSTAGAAEIRSNDGAGGAMTSLGTFSGNTQGASDSLIDELNIAPGANEISYQFDDMYFFYGPSAYFLGDISIEEEPPTAEGFYTDFTPNSGSTRYTQVDDFSASDGDSTYIRDSISGHRQTVSFPLPTTLAIVALNLVTVARQDDVGPAQFEELVRSVLGADDVSASPHLIGEGVSGKNVVYQAYRLGMINNPLTGLPFAAADFPLQLGTEIV